METQKRSRTSALEGGITAKTKTIVLSALTIAMCASLIAGGTLALFTGESHVGIEVTSGKVDVTANVTALAINSDAVGDTALEAIDDWTEATPDGSNFSGSFANGGGVEYKAADGIGTLTINGISPGDSVKFTVSVENKSTILVKYQMRLQVTKEDDTENKLSSVLEWYFNEKTSVGAQQLATAWSDPLNAETNPTSAQEVRLRLPKAITEDYQGKTCNVTLSVVAIQSNGSPVTLCGENHYYDATTNTCIYCGAENPVKGHLDPSTGNFVLDSLADPDATDVTIPGTVGGAPVSIPDSAFKGKSLESVTLEDGITEIGASAFEECNSLTDIIIPASVTEIGEAAFKGCKGLQSVTLGAGVTEIKGETNKGTFEDCRQLKHVEIKGDVTVIGDSAFHGCDSLTTIELPASLTKIGMDAFAPASFGSGLTSIDLSKCTNLTEIGMHAFARSAITEIAIPDSVTTLGKQAFATCASLQQVTLGTGVTKLEDSLFNKCSALQSLTINGTLESIGDSVFIECGQLATITYAGRSEQWKPLVLVEIYHTGRYTNKLEPCHDDCRVTCQGDDVTLDKSGNPVGA